MKGKGKVVACELNKERVKRLQETVRLSGAASILSKNFQLAYRYNLHLFLILK